MKNRIRLTESQLHNVIKESVKQVLSELDWKTKVHAANKARKNLQNLALNHAYNDVDPCGRYSTDTGVSPSRNFYKRTGKGKNEWVPERDEFIRKMKQADALSKYADEGIKDYFGHDSYYNNLNGVGNEFPAYRKRKPMFDDDHNYWDDDVIDYFPNSDVACGDYDEYPLSDMPKSYQKKAKEINDFQNGNYDYERNGRGWHLK